MTKREVIHKLGKENETIDYAIPLPWVESVIEHTGADFHAIASNFVWIYDALGGIMGRPLPLSVGAKKLLRRYNAAAGTHY